MPLLVATDVAARGLDIPDVEVRQAGEAHWGYASVSLALEGGRQWVSMCSLQQWGCQGSVAMYGGVVRPANTPTIPPAPALTTPLPECSNCDSTFYLIASPCPGGAQLLLPPHHRGLCAPHRPHGARRQDRYSSRVVHSQASGLGPLPSPCLWLHVVICLCASAACILAWSYISLLKLYWPRPRSSLPPRHRPHLLCGRQRQAARRRADQRAARGQAGGARGAAQVWHHGCAVRGGRVWRWADGWVSCMRAALF